VVESIPGGSNKFFDKFDFLDLPNAVSNKAVLPTPEGTTDRDININVEDFWRVEDDDTFHGYFSYMNYVGSITSPPCQEDTKWFIVEEPLKLGLAALEMFKDAVVNVPKL
jgi:carbonic anhydrase